MSNQVHVPRENEEVTIKVTMKELLALLGDKFNYDKQCLINARKKLKEQINK